jgi:hypothetical protein
VGHCANVLWFDLDARLEAYRRTPDMAAVKATLANATQLQGEIWLQAIAACREADSQSATLLLLLGLNAMIDIATTRTMAIQTHPPTII